MAIQTQQSFSGFVASDPQLTRTESGDARLYMKAGKEHYRQEEDGSFTQLKTTFHNLVAFKATVERGHARLAKGDKFVADGYVREYTHHRDGHAVEGEEFVALRLGHDMARTRYDVDRTPRRDAGRDTAAFTAPEHRPATQSPAATSM